MMANLAGIAIGINQYKFFQPLSCAQADAQALRLFLVEQAGWLPDRCLLLSETSPPVNNRSTYPSQENIIDWVDNFVKEPMQSGDLLWFFFSGYGITFQGEDYLMPIEGNPNDISTAISVRSLFERLKKRGDAPVLVLLDINRSQGSQGGTTVGHQTMELAKNLGIPTILSGQLDEFSHEAVALGHGVFTTGLLEVLHYAPELTLAGLEQYLGDRVPELSKHHELPVQTPLMAIPSPEAGNQLIFVNQQSHQLSGENDADFLTDPSHRLNPPATELNSTPVALADTSAQTESEQASLTPVSYTNRNSTQANQTTWWQTLLLWSSGALLVALMIAGVLLRNRDAFSGQQALQTSTNEIAPNSTHNSAKAGFGIKSSAVTTGLSGKPAPKTQNSKLSTSPKSQQETSQDVLNKARTLIVPNQASHFSQAIMEASKIPQGDPLYPQAEQDIARWSAVILDLAKGRAERGDFLGAIAAAQLVPSEQQPYAESQKAITEWKELSRQQQKNQVVLQAAKRAINSSEALSYHKAITAANKVPFGQPGYAESQKLTAQWSRKIYQMAEFRALKGKYQEAIETANLVPKNSPDYEAAQKAIALWKVKSKR